MSNPPAGWYPDPTGRPNTIRWWNGTKWTNKTEKETDADGSPNQPADPTDAATEAASADPAKAEPATADPAEGEPAGGDAEAASEAGVTAEAAGAGADTAAAAAQPTWTQPDTDESGGHWTQQPVANAGMHWTQRPAVDGQESQPAANTSGHWTQQASAQPDAAQAQDQAATGPWAQEQPNQEWTEGPGQGPEPSWSQGTEQAWSQDPNQGWTQDPNHGWTQDPNQGWTQTANQDWSQNSGQGWTQTSTQQSSPPLAEDQPQHQNPWSTAYEGSSGQQPPNRWQSADATQQQFSQPPLAPAVQPTDRDRKPGSGSRAPLLIAGVVALALIVGTGVFFFLDRRDATAGPTPQTTQPIDPATSTSATGKPSPAGTPTGGQTTVPAGQSKNPKLHEGNRISADAISYPRRQPPWSDRKRFVPQVLNSSGQYVLLQENFDGDNDWYADIFVGALGTSVLFNGDPRATAADLSRQLRSSLYGDISITARPLRNGAVKRSGKSGWFYQQSITANSSKVTARTLTLTVAVFDLGDGTAVAYVSDIPTNRADLKAAESQAYKGINVG
ncbi:MAG TPA: DUF2510 domain-containing protein [Kribbella sp.]|nr:DUF2510 domain-containing protein [Kribbella sp.]